MTGRSGRELALAIMLTSVEKVADLPSRIRHQGRERGMAEADGQRPARQVEADIALAGEGSDCNSRDK